MPLQRPCVSKLGNVTGVKWLALALPQKSFHVICDGFRHEIRRWSPRNGPKYSPKLVFRHPKWSRSTYGNPISGLLVSPFWSHQVPTGCQKGPKRAQHKGRSPLNCHFLENVVFHPFLGPGQMGPQLTSIRWIGHLEGSVGPRQAPPVLVQMAVQPSPRVQNCFEAFGTPPLLSRVRMDADQGPRMPISPHGPKPYRQVRLLEGLTWSPTSCCLRTSCVLGSAAWVAILCAPGSMLTLELACFFIYLKCVGDYLRNHCGSEDAGRTRGCLVLFWGVLIPLQPGGKL